MTDQDWDFIGLCVLIGLLAAAGIMQARVMKAHDEMLIRHDEDITFLRLVTREMEGKLADD